MGSAYEKFKTRLSKEFPKLDIKKIEVIFQVPTYFDNCKEYSEDLFWYTLLKIVSNTVRWNYGTIVSTIRGKFYYYDEKLYSQVIEKFNNLDTLFRNIEEDYITIKQSIQNLSEGKIKKKPVEKIILNQIKIYNETMKYEIEYLKKLKNSKGEDKNHNNTLYG